MRDLKTKYYIKTWCSKSETFTPQRGVRCGPYSLFGLRQALRRLRDWGYEAGRHDPAVYVFRSKAET